MRQRPLPLLHQQRQRQRPPQRLGEAARAGLQRRPVSSVLVQPVDRVIDRPGRRPARLGQRRVARRAGRGRHLLLEGHQPRRVVADGPQRVQRQHVRRAFPDRHHLAIAQQQGQAGVLHIACAAVGLQHLRGHGHRLPPRRQLGNGREQPQQVALGRANVARLVPADEFHQVETEVEGGLGLGLQPGQRIHVQRLAGEGRAEGHAPLRIVLRQGHPAAHRGRGHHAVPGARQVQHGDDMAHAVGQLHDRHGRRAVEQ